MQNQFQGFPQQCIRFWRELPKNNSKQWFEENRVIYEESVQTPARHFVTGMGARLSEIAPAVTADPRVNKSLFKIHRDVRFSQDKSPFKTHMGIWMWEGNRKRMECSGFYFHLEPPELMIAVGIYMFPKPHLAEFRKSVVHEKYGPALHEAISQIKSNDGFWVHGQHYKKTPRGFDPGHKYAQYLLHNGLTAGISQPIPQEMFSDALIDYCFERYRKLLPVHQWLRELTERL